VVFPWLTTVFGGASQDRRPLDPTAADSAAADVVDMEDGGCVGG